RFRSRPCRLPALLSNLLTRPSPSPRRSPRPSDPSQAISLQLPLVQYPIRHSDSLDRGARSLPEVTERRSLAPREPERTMGSGERSSRVLASRSPVRHRRRSRASEGDFGLANSLCPRRSILSDRGNPLRNSESIRQAFTESLYLVQQLVGK